MVILVDRSVPPDPTSADMTTSTQASAAPPSYEIEGDTALPSYSHTRPEQTLIRESTEHVYNLSSGKEKPWAILKLQSIAKSPDSIPIFLEGDEMVGSFELNVSKEHIIEVTIVVSQKLIEEA